MECLYLPDIDIHSADVIIEDEELHHLKVLRVNKQNTILATNGSGALAELIIESVEKKFAKAIICNVKLVEKPKYRTGLALGILDNRDRFEFALEKCIELGISDFYPLICKFSQKKSLNINRLEQKSISALKQSKRAWKTQIHEPIEINKIFSTRFDNYLYADMNSKIKVQAKNGDNLIIIGPEGGFSDNEINLIYEQDNLIPYTLGENRLRAETAAVSSVSILKYLLIS